MQGMLLGETTRALRLSSERRVDRDQQPREVAASGVRKASKSKKNHPRARLMDTSRVDGVKAPRDRGTPKSHSACFQYNFYQRRQVMNSRAGPHARRTRPARRLTRWAKTTATTRTAPAPRPPPTPKEKPRTQRSAASGAPSSAASNNSIARLYLYACIRKSAVDHPLPGFFKNHPTTRS